MTAEQFAALPDDGRRLELLQGRVVELTPPGAEHGAVAANVVALLHAFVKAHRLGRVVANDTGHVIARGPDTVRAPDVSFVAAERVPASGVPQGYWPFAPDLAVEVVSPHDSWSGVEAKTREWLEAGAREVWIVDPRLHVVRAVRRDDTAEYRAGATLTTDLLPGFSAGVDAIFEF